MPSKNAIGSDCVRVQAAAPSQRRLLLRLGLLWSVPLLCHAVGAGAASSAAAAPFDWSADPAAARAAALLTSIGKAHWVQEGAGPRIVYIFFDPNCPYSHKLYLATRAEVGKSGLALRWIPVGQLEASSPGKAAAILAAPDPLAAFHQNEDDWNFGDSPAGGIRPLSQPTAKVAQQLQTNAALMHQAGLQTFPVMLYRDASGRAHLIVGLLPGDTLATVLRSAR
ncbi:MAG: thioredoxin fold domain-containing protein [Thiomonas sp.]